MRSIGVPAVFKGLLLAIANTLVCAGAIAALAAKSDPFGDVFGLVISYGITPAITTGVLLGVAAGAVQQRRWIRLAILIPPAVGVVALLGHVFGLGGVVPLACIPTVTGVIVLERWTRVPVASVLPVARVT